MRVPEQTVAQTERARVRHPRLRLLDRLELHRHLRRVEDEGLRGRSRGCVQSVDANVRVQRSLRVNPDRIERVERARNGNLGALLPEDVRARIFWRIRARIWRERDFCLRR